MDFNQRDVFHGMSELGRDGAGAGPGRVRDRTGPGWGHATLGPGRTGIGLSLGQDPARPGLAGSKPGQARTGLGPCGWVKFGWGGSQFSPKLDAESDPKKGLPRTSLDHGGMTNLIRYGIQLVDACLS